MPEISIEREFYDNGVLKVENPLLNGKTHGTYKTWWKNGNPKYFGDYVDGAACGEAKHWYRNGKLSLVETFRDNMRFGISTAIDKNGNVTKTYLDNGKYLEFDENHIEMMVDFLEGHGYHLVKGKGNNPGNC
ncbi:hypothetical protein PEC18_04775 [Paucibacter sp. O1-1]|uniref:Toxin-antitoxin system YwqK family antitoxin n=1 Tax=Dyadobacter pollutisoli TaxID=2910158 RepID=A0A9E8NAQ3_9BACT|nr:hypothetical protein [Dyadobacter pollutisoli]MCU7370200.1 hypothetical protein [Paucibacter sp. O1-1]MDA3825185.1 hypothetical protein [Paucibacter sp. O1-1]WAC11878.1 hypothetical protein ON006_29625 [Dyadobacter pollutisoli]